MFVISNANPIRWVPVLDSNPALYQTVPFDNALQTDQTRVYQDVKPYFQKLTHLDAPITQILSSFTGITCKVYQCCGDGTVILTPLVVLQDAQITGVFASTLYEVQIDAALLANGQYYGILEYTPPGGDPVQWVSEPLEVADEWPGCLRYEYTHSRNDDSMVFQKAADGTDSYTGVMRVESDLIAYKPSSIDSVYADQVHNTTVVKSVTFRQWTLAVGGDGCGGVPDYLVDRLNRILSFDQVKIDGQFYTKSEGAQWEEQREQDDQFSEQKIVLTESENKFTIQVDTSGITDPMMAIQEILPFLNNTEDIVILNKFKPNTRLEFISIFNPTQATFQITIQTQTQGTDNDFVPQTWTVSGDLTKDITKVWLFDRDKTVTITTTRAPGVPLNIFVGYKKLQAIAGSSDGVSGAVPKNMGGFYHGSPSEFAADFDSATGLGIVGGSYEGFAVCDGNHGTPDSRDRMLIGTDGLTDLVDKPVNSFGGDWLVQIMETHLPVLQFALFALSPSLGSYSPVSGVNDVVDSQGGLYPPGSGGSFDQYRMQKNTGGLQPTVGRTSRMGGLTGGGNGGVGANFSVRGKYYRIIMIKKIA